eukprot:1310156-Rhodomonas_salina.1
MGVDIPWSFRAGVSGTDVCYRRGTTWEPPCALVGTDVCYDVYLAKHGSRTLPTRTMIAIPAMDWKEALKENLEKLFRYSPLCAYEAGYIDTNTLRAVLRLGMRVPYSESEAGYTCTGILRA